MSNLNPRLSRGNNDAGLLDWAERQYRPGTPPAVRLIASRYHLLPAPAATLADAFGIGGGE